MLSLADEMMRPKISATGIDRANHASSTMTKGIMYLVSAGPTEACREHGPAAEVVLPRFRYGETLAATSGYGPTDALKSLGSEWLVEHAVA